LNWLASHFSEIAPGYSLQLHFTGSLGGLIALAEGKADIAGSHLWDEQSGKFNQPFVQRFFPGKRIALVTLAHRRLGLILPAGNPYDIQGLQDLTRTGLHFANRQPGSGTRVWLDIVLRNAGVQSDAILGYREGKMTHFAVARAVAEGQADVGIGLEAAAQSYGLDFLLLTHDRYDLIVPEPGMGQGAIIALIEWLQEKDAREMIDGLGGYDSQDTGRVEWVN
jgi:molybdate-binding protein